MVVFLSDPNFVVVQHTSALQASVAQTLGSTVHWINHYPMDKLGKPIRYPPDRDFSGG